MRVKLTVLIERDGQAVGSLVKDCPACSVSVAEAITDCLTVVEAATGGDVDRLFAVHELAEMHDFIYHDDEEDDEE